MDECSYDPPICSQLCSNSHSKFTCSCATGYRLADDLRHCVALPWKNGGPFLVYSQANSIYQVSVKHGMSALPSLIHRSRGHVFSLGICSNISDFFYLSFTLSSIQTSSSTHQPPVWLQLFSCITAPTLWNSLPHSVRFCESLATLWKHLQTYFQAAFSDAPYSDLAPTPQIQFLILALYKFFYLLTFIC